MCKSSNRPPNRRSFLKQSGMMTGLLLLKPGVLTAATGDVLAQTTSGKVRGTVEKDIRVFRGIPYGRDTEAFRFRPPAPPVPWQGIRETTGWGPRAPQFLAGHGHHAEAGNPQPGYFLPEDVGPLSEDCLHLNLWTPALRDHGKRPVLVYIHGGAYNNGTVNSVLYDGNRLCHRGNVVVVTLNHRLNAFGYTYLEQIGGPEFAGSGNAGMLDLVLALRWIQENIAEFGGDPSRVLIFGQSGGGAKCATLMAMPSAQGLFHRVVTMSGQQVTATPPEMATERALGLMKNLGLTQAEFRTLLKLPMEKILEAARGANWTPVRDGQALPRDPFEPDAPAISASVPMILGNTHDETRLLIGGGKPELFHLSWEQLPTALQQNIAQFLGPYTPANVVEEYRKLYPNYSASDIFFAATTALRSWPGQILEAERRTAHPVAANRTWVYQMNWASPVAGGPWGAPHTIDIPFFFDNVELAPGMCGSTKERQEKAQVLASQMCETLLAFARTGNPNHPVLPHWPVYNLQERSTMIFDQDSQVMKDPRGAERRFAAAAHYHQPGT